MRILLPFDGSPASVHAARHVSNMLQGRNANVLLLNVQRVYVDAEMLHAGHVIVEFHRRDGEAALREGAKILEAAGIAHEARVTFGPVAEVIARTAKEAGFDAIVMGTRARHPFVEALTFSVPSRVLRRSEVPVTLVRQPRARRAHSTRGGALSAAGSRAT